MSREILAPPLQRMGTNRCYRVNLVHEDFGGDLQKRQQHQTQTTYTEPDLYAEDDDDDDEEGAGTYTIEELPNSMYKLTMHVAQSLYGGLIGFKGSTKRRIETETQTEIFVPRSREGGRGGSGSNNKSEDVTIKGKSRSNVCSARRKVNLLITSLKKRMKATHFLCVSLNYGEIKEKFEDLKKQILEANLPGIDVEAFLLGSHIHLTLNTCLLLDDAERSKAVELLQSCRQYLADLRTPFEIKVKGLEIMNDDPSSVRVLYACVDSPELQKFADSALQHYLSSGLGSYDHGRASVKLHMTVMKMRFNKQAQPSRADSFDAREILKRFGDFNFGTTQCSEVQLCVIGSSTDDAFYKTTGTLKF